jgi:regulator of sigma E protease
MLAFALNAFLWIAPFLIVLTLVVTFHELGHYWVAKAFGTAIDKFSIGFGRPIVKWRSRSGTQWQIGWMPLGGYVKFAGDENAASVPDAEDLKHLRREVLEREGPAALKRYFHFKPVWQRALVVLAGPAANFVLAILVFAAIGMAFGEIRIAPRVGEVTPGSPAARAGFVAGDLVVRANSTSVGDFRELTRYVMMRPGEPIRFTVERGGRNVELVATPEKKSEIDRASGATIKGGYLGIGSSVSRRDITLVRMGPIGGFEYGVRQTSSFLGTTLSYLGRVFTGRANGEELSGLIGIAGASKGVAAGAIDQSRSAGEMWLSLLYGQLMLVALISVAVGFANLLPIPVLDGGHLVFYAYEAVARRPLTARVQEAGYRVGFALLICLVVFATWNDLQRYRVFQFIGGLFS